MQGDEKDLSQLASSAVSGDAQQFIQQNIVQWAKLRAAASRVDDAVGKLKPPALPSATNWNHQFQELFEQPVRSLLESLKAKRILVRSIPRLRHASANRS